MKMSRAISQLLALLAFFTASQSEMTIYKTGWLDRVVDYFKQRFVADVQEKLPPIEFKASIVKAPPGYVDSKKWNYDSVMRLLKLIRSHKETRPLSKVLRRAMYPVMSKTRRFHHMSKQESYVKFPKHPQDVEVYYDDSYYDEYGVLDNAEDFKEQPSDLDIQEDAIIVVANPVESRLPSAHISVHMLREILEARAEAGRVMAITPRTTIPWVTTSSTADGGGDGDGNQTVVDGNSTEVTTQNASAIDGSSTDAPSIDASATDAVSVDASPTDESSITELTTEPT